MSSSLSITQQLSSDNKWEIIASINSGGTLPLDIFMYTNSGTSSLGAYQGVCDLPQYQKYQTFASTVIPVFGNKYLKHTQAKITVGNQDEATQVISVLTEDVEALSLALQTATPTTIIIPIP